MRWVIDSNVLIDLHHEKLLRVVLSLPVNCLSVDVALAELERPSRDHLLELGMVECELSGEQVLSVVRLNEKYAKPSRIDMFLLQLAIAEDAVLLTGDLNLRYAAHKEGVEVHGTLWLLDYLLEQELIDPPRAADSLRRMMSVDPPRRLPAKEVGR